MQTLAVTYSTIATILGKAPSFYVSQGDGGYDIVVVGDLVIKCRLAGDDADIANFQSVYLSKCTSVASEADAWVLGSVANRIPLVAPRSYDGRIITQPITAALGQWHTWQGAGDSASDIGEGPSFGKSHATAGWCEPVSWGYRDPVWVAGGKLKYVNAKLGDQVNFVIYAPATPITPNGANTGNCHLVYGVLIPAAGNGAYDVDLSTAVVIPTQSGTGGYWDYTMPTNMRGRGTIAPATTPGLGSYHLIPVRLNLTRFVINEALLGDGENPYAPDNPNPSPCLPCWKFECKFYNCDGAHELQAVWRVLNTRYWTTM